MKRLISSIIIIITILNCFGQNNKTLFHLYQPTESISIITEWNVLDTIDQRFLIKEIVDEKNRVISIQFLVKGKIEDSNPLYGIKNISYEYGENYIIERYLDYQNHAMTLLENETPTYRKYFLNEENELVGCKTIYSIEFSELTSKKLLEIEKSLKFWRENVIQEKDSINYSNEQFCEMNYIYGYLFSYIKMNGFFPKKENYTFDYDSFELLYSKEILIDFRQKY